MPAIPIALDAAGDLVPPPARQPGKDDSPYKRIADDLRGAIACGVLRPGDRLPAVLELARQYEVAFGTAQRALAELKANGLVVVSRGRRAVVVDMTKSVESGGKVVALHPRHVK